MSVLLCCQAQHYTTLPHAREPRSCGARRLLLSFPSICCTKPLYIWKGCESVIHIFVVICAMLIKRFAS